MNGIISIIRGVFHIIVGIYISIVPTMFKEHYDIYMIMTFH